MAPPPPAVEVHVEAPDRAWGPRAAAAWHLQHLWRTVAPSDDASKSSWTSMDVSFVDRLIEL